MRLDPNKTYIPDETIQPFSGLTVKWYNDYDVIVYELQSVMGSVVDDWAEYVQTQLAAWDTEKPYLAVHDLSKPGVSLQFAAMVNFDLMNIGVTMGGRRLAEEKFDAVDGWYGRVALNFNLSLSGQTNRTLMSYLDREHPAIEYKTFYNQTKCLRWLTTGVTDTSEMKAVGDDNLDAALGDDLSADMDETTPPDNAAASG